MITIKLWMIIVSIIYLTGLIMTIKQRKNMNIYNPTYKQILLPILYFVIHAVGGIILIFWIIISGIQWLSNYKPLIDLLNYQIYP